MTKAKQTVGFHSQAVKPKPSEALNPNARLSYMVANWWGDLADRLEEAIKTDVPNVDAFKLASLISREIQSSYLGGNGE